MLRCNKIYDTSSLRDVLLSGYFGISFRSDWLYSELVGLNLLVDGIDAVVLGEMLDVLSSEKWPLPWSSSYFLVRGRDSSCGEDCGDGCGDGVYVMTALESLGLGLGDVRASGDMRSGSDDQLSGDHRGDDEYV